MVSFIDANRGAYGVESICKQLPIAPSVYYEMKAREANPAKIPPRLLRDRELSLEQAIWSRSGAKGVVHHSDRGSQPELNWSSQHCFDVQSVALRPMPQLAYAS